MKRIVITGSTSMIGLAIIEEALGHDDVEQIYAVVRRDTKRIERLPDDRRITVVYCDAQEYNRLPEYISERCEVFYHIAWTATGENRNADILEQSRNIDYTLMALHAAYQLGCYKFIGAGSQAEYGRMNEEKASPGSWVNPIQPYGIAKFAAGKLALEEAKKLEMDCIWVRVFSVYGRYDKPTTMVASTISRLKAGERCSFTSATQMWDYLYSKDAGSAFYLIGKKSTGRKIYCLGSGESKQLRDFIEQMRDVVNPSAEIGFGEVPYPEYGPLSMYADISALQKDTGWKPIWRFCEGIADMQK